MDGVPATTEEAGKASPGRKNSQGARAVFKPKLLKELAPDLITTYTKIKNQTDRFKDSVTAVAEKVGCSSSNVMKFVRANIGDSLKEKETDAEQLHLMFEDGRLPKS